MQIKPEYRAYEQYRYYFPPRPEVVAPSTALTDGWQGWVGQGKLNGSCSVIATNGTALHVGDRHAGTFSSFKMNPAELKALSRNGKWNVFAGEYMNKSQASAKGLFNIKFVIHDLLVWEGHQLLGSNILERWELLNLSHSFHDYDGYISQVSDNVFRCNNLLPKEGSFIDTWKEITQIQMYEGLVLKRCSGKLQLGLSEKNNTSWLIKSRKPTKNYKY